MGLTHWASPDESLATGNRRISDAPDLPPFAAMSSGAVRYVTTLCHLVARAALLLVSSPSFAETNRSQSEQGEYVARAAGCMSCHGEDLAGGYHVETPMGTIVASIISPSQEHGIGGYNRDDLARVLREGVSPDRRLYPAMPYASFRSMTDTDIDVLHIWLQD